MDCVPTQRLSMSASSNIHNKRVGCTHRSQRLTKVKSQPSITQLGHGRAISVGSTGHVFVIEGWLFSL